MKKGTFTTVIFILVIVFLSILVFVKMNHSINSRGTINQDSLERVKAAFIDSFAKAKTDSIITGILFDTVGVSAAPVQIISSKIVLSESGSYKNIHIVYKNVSDKKIEAVKFRWYGVTAFDEPADMGTGSLFQPGFGSGFDDNGVNPGKVSSGTWEILSRNARKVLLAWPFEIVFKDGSKWKTSSK